MRVRTKETIDKWSATLQALSGAGVVTMRDFDVPGQSHATTAQLVTAIIRAGMIADTGTQKRGGRVISLTTEGRAALTEWRQVEAARQNQDRVAQPDRSNLFERPRYEPAKDRAYYRNNGNAHIRSLGV